MEDISHMFNLQRTQIRHPSRFFTHILKFQLVLSDNYKEDEIRIGKYNGYNWSIQNKLILNMYPHLMGDRAI